MRLVQPKEKMKTLFKTSIQLRKLVGVILLVCGLLLYGERRVSGAETEGKATIIVFDAPGASTGQFQGTFPTAINPAGAIVGYYYSTVLDQFGNNIPQAFLRGPNGKFTTFDPPGYPNNTLFINTVGNTLAINPAGAITGSYVDANGFVHGFLRVSTGGDERAPKVTFTTFDVPGPPGSQSTGTFASAINPAGAITGYYSDAGGTPHGFLRAPNGKFTSFDPPGFLRAPDGSFITFAIIRTPTKASSLTPSTRRGRSRETILQTTSITASCGPATVSSPPSIPLAPQIPPPLSPLTRRGRSRDTTLTQTSLITASCASLAAKTKPRV